MFIVEQFAVVADDVLHFFVHVVNAAVSDNPVALFFRNVVFNFHLIQLVEDLVNGIVDTDVE